MSDLETAARPIIGPLMSDMALTLDRGQQHVIARWSTKTAMVFECTNPTKDWFYTPAERQDLVAGTLPVGTSNWLGRFDRSNLSFVQAQRLFGSTAATVIGDGYLTTFALARLAIQVLTVRRHADHRATRVTLDVHSGPWDRALVQIWPPRAIVQWPPALSFSEERLTALCKRFTNPPL